MNQDTKLSAPNRRPAILIGAGAVVLVLCLVATLFIFEARHNSDAVPTPRLSVGHIHGIATDSTDAVVIGAHGGVFAMGADGALEERGERRSDTMAITNAADGRLLASGHPAPMEFDTPVNEGLLTSTDDAQTWQVTALAGDADFHALDQGTDRLWGIESTRGQLVISDSGAEWTSLASRPLIDVAADPLTDAAVVTTDRGELVLMQPAGAPRALDTAPVLAYVDWVPGALVGVSPDGRVSGQPTALTVQDDAWYVATDAGLFRTTDEGDTFTPLFRFDT